MDTRALATRCPESRLRKEFASLRAGSSPLEEDSPKLSVKCERDVEYSFKVRVASSTLYNSIYNVAGAYLAIADRDECRD